MWKKGRLACKLFKLTGKMQLTSPIELYIQESLRLVVEDFLRIKVADLRQVGMAAWATDKLKMSAKIWDS